MAIHIEHLNIEHFRGIHHLHTEKLNHINIIAGDNNSGKTSVLEALLLLRNPSDFTNILRVARMRDTAPFISGASVYESFLNLFPRGRLNMEILLSAICKGTHVSYKIYGEQIKIMMEPEDVLKKLYPTKRARHARRIDNDYIEVDLFRGKLETELYGQNKTVGVELDALDSATGREIKSKVFMDIVYLSPIDHVRGLVFDQILRNEAYKEICLSVLQLFDPEILDLLILKNEETGRTTEYIKHNHLGNMPLTSYGDGIKKVLALANAIAHAAGGVLLIDEIETAIHSKYYDDIFKFLVKAAIQFDVQVFITTHSIEAIDGLLATQSYNNQSERDEICVLTFKKDIQEKKTFSRNLTGRHVQENRLGFGFEVRF